MERTIILRPIVFTLVFMLFETFGSGPALAQDLIIYPNIDQSQKQLEKDKFERYSWAK